MRRIVQQTLTPQLAAWLPNFPYQQLASWVAYCDEEVVGVAVTGSNCMHPINRYVELVIAPNYRRQGWGTRLFQAIVAATAQPLQWSGDETACDALVFVEKVGFQLKRRCWEYEVETDSLASRWQEETSLPLCSVDKLNSTQLQQLQKQVVAHYRTVHHAVNPLTMALSLAEIYQCLTTAMTPAWSFCLLDSCGDVSCWVLVESDGSEAFVTYVGRHKTADWTVYEGFLAQVLRRLAQQFERLSFEVDDVDEEAMCLQRLLSVELPAAYCNYVYTQEK